eukprot:1447429-Alexandrium_andersonii.AAC.1
MEQSRDARSDCVVSKDPRAKAVGGRTPWVKPLSDPRVVARDPGTSLNFRRAHGFATGETHVVEKVVRIRGPDDGDKQFP